jgi:TPP-dependent pyruvate/acetoin dehydrogenase alpha subunit
MRQVCDPSDLYRKMLRIRRFEERVLDAFSRDQISGTTHTYIGQEANAVGVLEWLQEGDVVISNHRCHGHFLAYGGSMFALAAEIMGRESGLCGGRGGSQHLQWKDFLANGILGGTIPLAVGAAFAEKQLHVGHVVFAFMGDGTLGQGVVYESLNMASLWKVPILFILEDNRYAQTTPIHLNLAGEIAARFEAFGIPTEELDSTDVMEIHSHVHPLLLAVQSGGGPHAMIIHTYRFAPHSKGDDTRDPEEIAHYRSRDPLEIHGRRLSLEERAGIEGEVQSEIDEVFKRVEAEPFADPSSLRLPLDAKT